MNIEELVTECKRDAETITKKHHKKASLKLYEVLAKCLYLCERCLLDKEEKGILRQLFNTQSKRSKNRRYLETDSDIYIIVCRFMFEDDPNNNRYSHCLREAAKLQIRSSELVSRLRQDGGLNALYMRRPLEKTSVSTKTLHLTKSINCPKNEAFTITLRKTPDNKYEVIDDPTTRHNSRHSAGNDY